jgi:cell division septation protein DedD
VVEAIFNEGREASPSPAAKIEPKMAPRTAPKAVNTTAAEASVTHTPSITTAINTVTVPVEDDEEAALAAQLAAIKAKKAAKALVAQVENKVPPQAIVAAAAMLGAGVDPDSMSDDEFIKAYGNRN